MARYVILKNTEKRGKKTAAFKIEDDCYYLGTVNDPYDVGTFEEIPGSGRKTNQIITVLEFILSKINNNNDTATMPIDGNDYDALRVSENRLFGNVDEKIKKQFDKAIKIKSNKVDVDFQYIFQEVREVSSILKKRYEERGCVGFDFLIKRGADSLQIEKAIKKNRLTIIRSLTGGINQALLSSAFKLAEDKHKNVIYLEKFERNTSPLFNAIKAEYKTDLMNATNVQIYILINLQNDKIVPDNYLIEGLLEDTKALLKKNSQANIIIGYKDAKTIEEPLERILNTENKDFYTLGYDQKSLLEYFNKMNISRPEDENISQLLEKNMGFLCDYALNHHKSSDLDNMLLSLNTEDIIETYRDDQNQVGTNNITFFSVMTSILYEYDAMDMVFKSEEFNKETIESLRNHYPFYLLNTVEDYRRVGRSLNAMTKEGWADSTDNYYIARGIIDRIRTGRNFHGVLRHLENKLHTDKPESSELLTARFLIDELNSEYKSMDAVLENIPEEEDKILFIMILGRLLDHFETIRNGKKYIADKVKIAIKYLKDYWIEEPDKEDLEYLLVSLCYGALQTQGYVGIEDFLSLCKTSKEALQSILDTGHFDKDDLPATAIGEKSRILSNLGATYLAMGKALMKDESKKEESKSYLKDALSAHKGARNLRESIKENPEILEKEPDFISKRYAKSLTNIATCYYWLGDNENSKKYHEMAAKEIEKSESQSILHGIRFGGTLLESTLSKKQEVLQIVRLFKHASDLMKGNPGQYHAEVQNLQDNYMKLIEKLKNKRTLLCRCIFDLLDLAVDVDGLYYSEYYNSNNACKYRTLRTFISPVEKLFEIYKEEIKSTLKIIKNRNKNDLHLANAFELAENPSASELSDANYVSACHFILNNCFDYRWKMKVIKENATKKRIKEEDKVDLELVKSYFNSVVKVLNPASKEIRWRCQEDEDNLELSNIMEKISSTRQGIIDDETAQKHRDEIIDIIKDFDLLNSNDIDDSEFENIKKSVIICPLGATTNAIYNRTKAACDLFEYFTEKNKASSVIFYGLGSEKTDSIDYDDFVKLAKEKNMPTWDKDKEPSETDVMLHTLKHLFSRIEMTKISTRDTKSERYIENVNCIHTTKDEKFVIASFNKKSSNTRMQTYHVLNKYKKDCFLIFVSTSIYRNFTISIIKRNMKELNIDAKIHFFGTEYEIKPEDSVCKAVQEIKVSFDEIIKTYE